MTNWTRFCGSTALFILSVSSPAIADVTAQDVWNDWRGYLESTGYGLDAEEAMSGDTLTVSALTLTMDDADGDGSFAMTVDELSFTENSDGTVTVSIPQVLPITASGVGDDGESVEMVIETTQSGLSMVVSGDADAQTYNYTAANLGIALRDLVVDGQKIETAKAQVDIANILGSTSSVKRSQREISQTMTAKSVAYDFSFVDPQEGGNGLIKGTLENLAFSGSSTVPEGVDANDMSAMLAAGFTVEGAYSYANSASTFSFVEGNDAMAGESKTDSSQFELVMNADTFSMDGASKGTVINLAGGDIPVPVNLSIGNMGFNMAMPVAKSEDEQSFALGLDIGGLAVTDMIWNIFDPASVLPRDPAVLRFDIAGKVKVLTDLFDPDQMEAVERGEAAPGELNALTLRDFELALVGARVTGEGDFTFDNSDTSTFNGVPRPTGAVDLKLVGVNGLIDKLIQMGFLPEEQAMGARMMMGVFATPGDGDDTLVSKIEVNDQGHVLANGQRLQ